MTTPTRALTHASRLLGAGMDVAPPVSYVRAHVAVLRCHIACSEHVEPMVRDSLVAEARTLIEAALADCQEPDRKHALREAQNLLEAAEWDRPMEVNDASGSQPS